MEGVGKCIGVGESKVRCVGGVGNVLGCGKVWGGVGVGMWKCVWGVGNVFGMWGEVWKECWGAGKCWEKCRTIWEGGEVWGGGWCYDLGPQLSLTTIPPIPNFSDPTFPDSNSPNPNLRLQLPRPQSPQLQPPRPQLFHPPSQSQLRRPQPLS